LKLNESNIKKCISSLPYVRDTLVGFPKFWSSSHSSVNHLIKVIIMGKDHMASHIVQKSFRSHISHGKTSSLFEAVNHQPIFVLGLLQAACSAKASRTSSNNENINFFGCHI
jgi:hypothetical protein